MQKVIVMNRQRAINMTFNDFAIDRVIISISSLKLPLPSFNNNNHSIRDILFLQFDDEDTDSLNSMSIEDAAAIARFACCHWDTDNQIVVHCDGGVSRSAGIAAAILKHFTNDDSQIFNNKKYCPNMWCYRLVLEALQELDRKEFNGV